MLAELHRSPSRETYDPIKTELDREVVQPFKRLVRSIAQRLSPSTRDLLETEKRVFAQFRKNDYGGGGVWDFFWSAFYPKGSERTRDAQLFVSIYADLLEFGFSFGRGSSEQLARFIQNLERQPDGAKRLLAGIFVAPGWLFDERHHSPEAKACGSWEEWSNNPNVRIRASISLSRDQMLAISHEQLSATIAEAFERLVPLMKLATSDELPSASPEGSPAGASGGSLSGARALAPVISVEDCGAALGIAAREIARWVRAIDRKGQAIIYGPPGTGKTFAAEHLARLIVGGSDGLIDLVQFHPAYSYEDFIQGIRPRTSQSVSLEYPLAEGRFLQFLREAAGRSGKSVLIIDEINRANLARVFGELMFLLEYRDREVSLAGGGKLRIPPKIRVIGTMNTADRSIALVDHALRRRFAFISLHPDYEVLRRYHEKTGFRAEGLIEVLRSLNQQIGDSHYEVGISFFLCDGLDEQIEDIWRMEIEPYLEEYFFDQHDKVDRFRWDRLAAQLLG